MAIPLHSLIVISNKLNLRAIKPGLILLWTPWNPELSESSWPIGNDLMRYRINGVVWDTGDWAEELTLRLYT